MVTVNTRFHLREKVFGDLKSVRHAARKPGQMEPADPAAGTTVGVEPPTGPEPVVIDSLMFGEPELMASYLLPGPSPALIDPGPANTAPGVIAELAALGVTSLSSIVLTHIHLDHAAGASILARHFPEATVYIHGRVAAHLIDPSKLILGVKSVWGEQTEQLFGLPGPIAAERVVAIDDGDRIGLGDRELEAIATPGHTRSHLAFSDSGTGALFCGDAIGIQLPASRVIRPSTPPSDFSYDDAIDSIRRLDEQGAESVQLPHFGQTGTEPGQVFDEAEQALRKWHERFLDTREAAESDLDLQRRFNACVEASLEPVTPVTRNSFEAINPVWLNIAGMSAEAERLIRPRDAA